MKIEHLPEFWNRSSQLSQNCEKLLNITTEDLRKILTHYNVSVKALEYIVDSIKEWYDKQPHLPKGYLEDTIIVQHLILKGFSIEEVKDKIDNCVSAKHKMPEILLNKDPMAPEIDKCLRFGFLLYCLRRHPTIIESQYSDYRVRNDASLGEQWIFDLTNVSFQNSVQMTPMLITKLIFYLRFCFGAKIKGIHFVNMPSFVGPLLNIMKKLMKPKVAKRIHVYNKFEDLYQLFPKNIFPKEYGGDEISCQEIADEWTQTIQSDAWRKYFAEHETILSDESKRTRFLNSDEFLGCQGSFRKLEVD